MKLLIIIYYAVNIFAAGYEFKSKMDWARSSAEKLDAYIASLLYTSFFIPYMILIFIWAFLKWMIWNPINDHLQAGFLFQFYLTKKWDNIDNERLYQINKRGKMRKEGDNRIGARMFTYCVNLLNERNNYTFVERTPEEMEF